MHVCRNPIVLLSFQIMHNDHPRWQGTFQLSCTFSMRYMLLLPLSGHYDSKYWIRYHFKFPLRTKDSCSTIMNRRFGLLTVYHPPYSITAPPYHSQHRLTVEEYYPVSTLTTTSPAAHKKLNLSPQSTNNIVIHRIYRESNKKHFLVMHVSMFHKGQKIAAKEEYSLEIN